MEDILDRRGRRLFTGRLQSTVLATRRTHIRASEWGPQGSDRGVRGSVVSGARGRRRRAQTRGRPLKRIGRRESPGPPVSIIQGASPRAKGRGASLEEMLGTNVARVLVVEEVVGSRSRSKASGSCSLYCRKAGQRRAGQPVANCSIR